MPALRGHLRHFRYLGEQSQAPPMLQHIPEIWRERMSAREIDTVIGIVREFRLGYYQE